MTRARIQTIALLLLALLTPRVTAQSRSDYTPDFDARNLATLVEELALTPEQAAEIESRLDAYGTTFRAAATDVRRRVAKEVVRLEGPDDDIDKALARTKRARAAILEAWKTERARLRDSFVADLRDSLTDDQNARWPALERRLRRDRLLARGRLSGESIDLHRVVGELDLARALEAGPPPAVKNLLEAYAIELDRALRALAALPGPTDVATGAPDPDYDPTGEIEARIRVRDVNLAYAERIAAELPGGTDDAFGALFNRLAFPMVYRATSTQQRLRNALIQSAIGRDRPDARLVVLEMEYLARLADVRERLRATVVKHEPARFIRRLEQRHLALESPARDGGDDPIREAFEEVRELDQEIMDRLRERDRPGSE